MKPILFAGRDEREEALYVNRKIAELREDGVELTNIAVLFRSGFHSYKLELELNSSGVEFEKRGGLKLTESAHMKDVIAFLRLQVNLRDSLSWNRILLQLNKVGPKTASKITDMVTGAEYPLQALAEYPAGKTWKGGMAKLVQLFFDMEKETAPGVLFELIMAYYQPLFEQIYRDDYPKRQKDLDQLKSIVSAYEDVQSFVDDTTLDPPDTVQNHGEKTDRMILSTIHSSKGLEWDAVFVVGLAEGRFPHMMAGTGEQLEEERRLLYVAATRARKYLFLTYPRQLMTPDRQFKRVGMSPFLSELQAGLFERVDNQDNQRASGFSFSSPSSPAVPAYPRKKKKQKLSIKDLTKGVRVRHPFFGEGTIKNSGQGRSVDVDFERHGIKTLHLDYAKLSLL